MPPRDTTPTIIEIDWNDDGQFDHPASDVTQFNPQFRSSWGASPGSNPQQPIMQSATGRLTLFGAELIDNTLISRDRLVGRHAIRVTRAGTVLFNGFVTGARTERLPPRVSFKIESSSEYIARSLVNVTQGDNNAVANSAVLIGTLIAAFAPFMVTANIQPTELGQFDFSGPAARYATQFGLTAGAFVQDTHDGDIRLTDPFEANPTVIDIDAADYRIANYKTINGDDHIRNIAEIVFAPVSLEEEAPRDQDHNYHSWRGASWFGRHPSQTGGISVGTSFGAEGFTIPAPTDGFTISDVEVVDGWVEVYVPVVSSGSNTLGVNFKWLNPFELNDNGDTQRLFPDGEDFASLLTDFMATENMDGSWSLTAAFDADMFVSTWRWTPSPGSTWTSAPRTTQFRAHQSINTSSINLTSRFQIWAARAVLNVKYTLNPPEADTEIVGHAETVHDVDDTTTTIDLDLPELTGLAEYQSVGIASLDVETQVTRDIPHTRCVQEYTANTPTQIYATEAEAIAAGQAAVASSSLYMSFTVERFSFAWRAILMGTICTRYETFTQTVTTWERSITHSANAESASSVTLNSVTGGTAAATLTLSGANIPSSGNWRIVVGLETESDAARFRAHLSHDH